jgi:hypothetical protein
LLAYGIPGLALQKSKARNEARRRSDIANKIAFSLFPRKLRSGKVLFYYPAWIEGILLHP